MSCCSVGAPKVPTFPLLMNVWYGTFGTAPPVGLPNQANVPCLYSLGELTTLPTPGVLTLPISYIKCAKATDIQWVRGPAGQDMVECPAGSGLFFMVSYVQNIGRGFANEHRVVIVYPVGPYPMPLP